MYCLLAALLLHGAVAFSPLAGSINKIQVNGVTVNTSTSGMDEAGGSAGVPSTGWISDTLIGGNIIPKMKPPKRVNPTDDISISSNSKVVEGNQVNQVDTKVQSIGKPWMPGMPMMPGKPLIPGKTVIPGKQQRPDPMPSPPPLHPFPVLNPGFPKFPDFRSQANSSSYEE